MTLEPLEPKDFSQVQDLFTGWQYHLAPLAVVAQAAAGEVYVAGGAASATAALVRAGRRFHLAGDPEVPAFNRALLCFFDAAYSAQAGGEDDMFQLYYANPGWESVIAEVFKGRFPIKGSRQVYSFHTSRQPRRCELPPGFDLLSIDRKLFLNANLENRAELAEELVSEAPSLEAFFESRFGVCLLHEDKIVSWCLSEYNCGERCEAGIATIPAYRRRGLASAVAAGLIAQARSLGIQQVGWHCWSGNRPSAATALRVGFELQQEYEIYYGWFNPAINLAANGNQCLWRGQYPQALAWYRRACDAGSGNLPGWALWNAACAYAETGERETALQYLHAALEKGFGSLEELLASEHLLSLRSTSAWQDLVSILEKD